MKKFLLSALALLAALTVSGQNGSTVLEWSLSDSREEGDNPTWTIAALGGLEFGFAHRFDAPARTNPSGFFVEVSFCELRFRPWQNGNLFSLAIDCSSEAYRVDHDATVNATGEIVALPNDHVKSRSTLSDCAFHANFGYTHEFGKLSAGVFVCPGIGYCNAQTNYRIGGTSLRLQEDLRTDASFRLAVKAAVWYDYFGIVFGYNFGNVGPEQELPRRSSAFVGVSLRF